MKAKHIKIKKEIIKKRINGKVQICEDCGKPYTKNENEWRCSCPRIVNNPQIYRQLIRANQNTMQKAGFYKNIFIPKKLRIATLKDQIVFLKENGWKIKKHGRIKCIYNPFILNRTDASDSAFIEDIIQGIYKQAWQDYCFSNNLAIVRKRNER